MGVRPAAPLAPSASSTFFRASRYFFPCLANDFEPHRTRRTLDHLDCLLHLVGVQVFGLGLCDSPQLVASHAADLLPPRLGRTLLDACGPLQEADGRRGLEYGREAWVLEDRDLGRNDLAALLRRALVVRPAELHDVDSVGAKHRTHRGGRRGLAGLEFDLQDRANLLLSHLSPSGLRW